MSADLSGFVESLVQMDNGSVQIANGSVQIGNASVQIVYGSVQIANGSVQCMRKRPTTPICGVADICEVITAQRVYHSTYRQLCSMSNSCNSSSQFEDMYKL
jgi:hypothetical protein